MQLIAADNDLFLPIFIVECTAHLYHADVEVERYKRLQIKWSLMIFFIICIPKSKGAQCVHKPIFASVLKSFTRAVGIDMVTFERFVGNV